MANPLFDSCQNRNSVFRSGSLLFFGDISQYQLTDIIRFVGNGFQILKNLGVSILIESEQD